MPRKLRFRWISPFWVTKEFNGSYQLGTLVGVLLSKWASGFRLKPYKGRMAENPLKERENSRNTENRIELMDTPAETEGALEANVSVEPGTTDK